MYTELELIKEREKKKNLYENNKKKNKKKSSSVIYVKFIFCDHRLESINKLFFYS